MAHFADAMFRDRGDSLRGKRCLITGAGKTARTLAQKLESMGAVVLTFSDPSGHVYEPDGFSAGKLRTIDKIKSERGALLGRYVISSTTAQFNDPPDIYDIPCDICFPCGAMKGIDEHIVAKLADNGCQAVIDGVNAAVTKKAWDALKEYDIMHGPYTLTMTGPAIVHSLGDTATDALLAENVARIYKEVKDTATEFNARGDLFTGANILGFLRVANAMMKHGAV